MWNNTLSSWVFPTMKTLNDVNKKNDVKSKATEEVKAEPDNDLLTHLN